MKRPALNITRFIPLLVSRKCERCGFDFRFTRGWIIGTQSGDHYYMCGECGGTTKHVVNTWFCKYLKERESIHTKKLRELVIRTPGAESNIWHRFRSCLEGKKMFFQLAKIPGIRHDHRTLILEAEVPEAVDDLVKRVPAGPIRIFTEDGVIKSISFHEEE